MRQADRPTLREECLEQIDALYGAALRMTGNSQDAEDLVQETYLKAVRGLRRYRQDAPCRAWLFRILTNAYIDRYRKSRRSPTPVEFEDDGATGMYARAFDEYDDDRGSLPAWEDTETFLSRFVTDEVKAALDGMADVFREVIVLRDIEGFSYRECAEMLEIPIGTVMSRLHRGRRALQDALRTYARRYGYGAPAGLDGGARRDDSTGPTPDARRGEA